MTMLPYGKSLPRNTLGEIRAKKHDNRKLTHSIADVVDNSIDGGAMNIDIYIDENRSSTPDPYGRVMQCIKIIDDGRGIEAENLAGIIEFNTTREYLSTDLGSFGLGLKDALLAHGDEITVFSKTEGQNWAMVRLSAELSEANKDWTYVDHDDLIGIITEWGEDQRLASGHELGHWATHGLLTSIDEINSMNHGTIVLLEFLHRLVMPEDDDELAELIGNDLLQFELQDNANHAANLEPEAQVHDDEGDGVLQDEVEEEQARGNAQDDLETVSKVDVLKEWLSMIFSQYLSGLDIGDRNHGNPLKISLDGTELTPLDPFMRDQIGVGDFNGQQGTLKMDYDFNYFGLNMRFEKFILPRKSERASRHPSHDDRMRTATGLQIENLQGIYITRNGRILDGPWNGRWRREGLGMDAHNTVNRMNLVLPPESINFEELVPPDKSRVNLDGMLRDILLAHKEKHCWHEQDAIPYGTSKWGQLQDVMDNVRGRARQDGKDKIRRCQEDGCEARVVPFSQTHCGDHRVISCANADCDESVDNQGDICPGCIENQCREDGCQAQSIEGEVYCLPHNQEECTIEGCNLRSLVGFELCQTHHDSMCVEPGCTEQSLDGVTRCDAHLTFTLGGIEINLSTHGALLRADGETHNINIHHDAFIELLSYLQTIRS
jgi:hypothetical protein